MTRYKDADNEAVCPSCRQKVPLRKDGTRVTHYEKIKAAYGRKGGQRICKGSQEARA